MRVTTFLFTILLIAASASAQDQRRLEFSITGAAGQTIRLASYYGNRLYYADTAVADARGTAVFARTAGYKAGVYAVLTGAGRFVVLVNEPVVRMATEAADPAGKVSVIESRENQLYHVDRKNAEAASGAERAVQLATIVRNNPGTLAATVIHLGMDPDRTDVKKADGTLDSAATADRFLQHVWDGVDLRDERLPCIPAFQDRLDEVIAARLPKDAAVVERYLEDLIARGSPALREFVLRLVTDRYFTSGTQGMGALPIRMALRHVCTAPGTTPGPEWTPVEKWEPACATVRAKSALVPGGTARDLVLADTTEQQWVSLLRMPQEILVIAFWSPHCNHCKQAIPALHAKYNEVLKPLGAGVFAVAEAGDESLFTDWKAFVREHHLDWVNVGIPWHVYDLAKKDPARYVPSHTTMESLNYKETWEALNTPKYYVLDKERRIVGSPGTINELITMVREAHARTR